MHQPLEWPNADHQDIHHKKMMTLLPPGLPFSISKKHAKFFDFLLDDNWHMAAHLVESNQIPINIQDKHCNNIYDYAANYVVLPTRDAMQLKALFSLVEKAIKFNLKIRMNYAFYFNPFHTLARRKEDDITLKLIDLLLSNSDPIYLNAYNKFGKTPLLEAISKLNKETIFRFLEQPQLDVSLFKIHNIRTRKDAIKAGIMENINIELGMTGYDAAVALNLNMVAQRIKHHPSYNQNKKYAYPNSGDIIRIEHFLFAEQGNVDTIKVLFKNFPAEILMSVDDLNWTMLHIACFAANLPVVKILLDKNTLDTTAEYTIPENVYSDFVNRRSESYSTALGRVLMAEGQSYDIKKEECISLFIKCPYFKVNEAIQCSGDALIHYIAENHLMQQMLELAERPDVNFDKENLYGQTALEIAALDGNSELVDLLSKLVKEKNISINPNRYARKCALVERLKYFMEEQWFGPVSIDGLTIDNLIEIYSTKEPHKIKVTYREFVLKCEITPLSSQVIDNLELIKWHLSYCFNRIHNEMEMRLVDFPRWIDTNLYREIKRQVKNKFKDTSSLNSTFILNVNGTSFKVSVQPQGIQQVTRTGTISYERLLECLDNEDSPLQREQWLLADYSPLLAMVIDKAQQTEDIKIRNNFIKVIKSLVLFPKIKLNILSKRNEIVCYLDEIVTLPEIASILEEARANQKKAVLPARKKNLLSDKLIKSKKDNSIFFNFAKSFAYHIETKNIERQFNHFYSEKEYRRMDALARLFEGDGICAAVCFFDNKLYYATNFPNNGSFMQHEIIKDVLDFFSKINTNLPSDKAIIKIELIKRIVEAKSLEGFSNKAKKELFKSKVLNPLLEKMTDNILNINELVFENKLHLDKSNTLTNYSLQKILDMCGLEQWEKLNKTDEGTEIVTSTSFIKRINAIIKFFIRALLDFKKIEDYMNKNPNSNFTLALLNKHSFIIEENEEYHAEMKLLKFILDNNLQHTQFYIGISKLCCAHCNLVLNCFFENLKHSKGIKTRGFHGEDSKWHLPIFMSTPEGFENIFANQKELCSLFKDSFNANKDDTLAFIRDYSILKNSLELDFLYTSLSRGLRSQEHAWSDSESEDDLVIYSCDNFTAIEAKDNTNTVGQEEQQLNAVDMPHLSTAQLITNNSGIFNTQKLEANDLELGTIKEKGREENQSMSKLFTPST